MQTDISKRREFWRGRPVFVTGGTGFLGGWVIRRLLEMEAEVVALVRDGAPRSMAVREGLLDQVAQVHGSLEDEAVVQRAMGEYGIDTVLHLAAQPIVGVAKADPVGTMKANITGTWNVLEGARRSRVRQVVVASSDKAYGSSDRLPYTEEHPLEGRYPYDCSKSCADLIAQCYLATYNLPVSVVRCANLFGGGDLNFSRTIPGAIQATLDGKPFVIRSDGQFVRDFLYIKDAADSYLFLTEALAAGAPQGPYNFSLEVKLTVLDCANRVLALMNRRDLQPQILNQASGEIREQYMDCSKARRVLGWAPAYSVDQALEETIGWYQAWLEGVRRERAGVVGAGAA